MLFFLIFFDGIYWFMILGEMLLDGKDVKIIKFDVEFNIL